MGSDTQDVSINNNRMMFQTHPCKKFLGFAPEVSQNLKLLSAISAAIPEEGAIISLLLYRGDLFQPQLRNNFIRERNTFASLFFFLPDSLIFLLNDHI